MWMISARLSRRWKTFLPMRETDAKLFVHVRVYAYMHENGT